MSAEFTKFTVRARGEQAEWINSAYELYRGDSVASKRKPMSLNKFLLSLIEEGLSSDIQMVSLD